MWYRAHVMIQQGDRMAVRVFALVVEQRNTPESTLAMEQLYSTCSYQLLCSRAPPSLQSGQ
jgi:hypothetical protein